jgi:hypothetical protein
MIAGAQLQAGLALAAQQRPAARPQFVQAEGLQHEIVGAAVKTAYARIDLLPSGEHQDRQFSVEGTKLFEHLFTVFHRQIQVKDGEVGQLLAEGLHGCSAVQRQAHPVAIGFQATAQEHAQCPIVLGN